MSLPCGHPRCRCNDPSIPADAVEAVHQLHRQRVFFGGISTYRRMLQHKWEYYLNHPECHSYLRWNASDVHTFTFDGFPYQFTRDGNFYFDLSLDEETESEDEFQPGATPGGAAYPLNEPEPEPLKPIKKRRTQMELLADLEESFARWKYYS